MNVIHIFAQLLSEKMNKKLLPCEGFIRLAFQDANLDPNSSRYEGYKKVFGQYLKSRLEWVEKDNDKVTQIVKYMRSELTKNQAVFTMGA